MQGIECDRNTVRATNTGSSTIVDHHDKPRWFSERDRQLLTRARAGQTHTP